jgi:hypothetical protein
LTTLKASLVGQRRKSQKRPSAWASKSVDKEHEEDGQIKMDLVEAEVTKLIAHQGLQRSEERRSKAGKP